MYKCMHVHVYILMREKETPLKSNVNESCVDEACHAHSMDDYHFLHE